MYRGTAKLFHALYLACKGTKYTFSDDTPEYSITIPTTTWASTHYREMCIVKTILNVIRVSESTVMSNVTRINECVCTYTYTVVAFFACVHLTMYVCWPIVPLQRQMSLSRDAEVYFPPSEKEEEIYQQMAERKMCEIPRPLVKLKYKLGEGEFGVVYKGQWYSHTGNREVAVKVMRDGSTEKDKIKVLQEAVIMGQFFHQHVVQFYGILTLMEPVSVADVYTHTHLFKLLHTVQCM